LRSSSEIYLDKAMEQDKSMTGFGRLSEKGKMKVAPYNVGF
jgi:hypothetical protein